jgi:hypothetical protein
MAISAFFTKNNGQFSTWRIVFSLAAFVLIVIFLVFLFWTAYLDWVYQDAVTAANQAKLYIEAEALHESYSAASFYDNELLDQQIHIFETVIDATFTQYVQNGIITDDTYLLSTQDMPITPSLPRYQAISTTLRAVDSHIHGLYAAIHTNSSQPISSVLEPLDQEYRDRFRLVDLLIWDVLLNDDGQPESCRKKVGEIISLCQLVMRETPQMLSALYSFDLFNKVLDCIYALHTSGRMDDEMALSVIDLLDDTPFNQSIEYAMRNEFYVSFPRLQHGSNSANNHAPNSSYHPLFKIFMRMNQIALIHSYINCVENAEKPYHQSRAIMNREDAFPGYLVIAQNHFAPLDTLIIKRDILQTRAALLKLAVQCHQHSVDSISGLSLSLEQLRAMDRVSGDEPAITPSKTGMIIHSSLVDQSALDDHKTLFKDGYGPQDLQWILQ